MTMCGPPADMWAYGVTAFELLTAIRGFLPNNPNRPTDILSSSDAASEWGCRSVADLHKDWVRASLSLFTHSCFIMFQKYTHAISMCGDSLSMDHFTCCIFSCCIREIYAVYGKMMRMKPISIVKNLCRYQVM